MLQYKDVMFRVLFSLRMYNSELSCFPTITFPSSELAVFIPRLLSSLLYLMS